jgi:hypothetical protein
MRPKDVFWIGAKGGLLEHKHIRAMGPSVWMFLYLLRGQTGLNPAGEGLFNYGNPITFEKVSDELNGTPVPTIRRWVARLKKYGYIRVQRHSRYGITIWISKGKSKTRRYRFYSEVEPRVRATRTVQTSGAEMNWESETSSAKMSAKDTNSRHDFNASADELFVQSEESSRVAEFSEIPTPKGFISKNLLNYNKALKSSLSLLGKEKSVYREKPTPSKQQIEARRRMLLKQAKQIRLKSLA